MLRDISGNAKDAELKKDSGCNLTGFLWLTVLLEPANLLWHMGSYVCFPVRYGYMAVLSMAALVAVRKERDADDFHTENV